jgi:simple sugar transport system substrate-binding protein
MHIGQPEYVAGHAAGERAKQDGIKTFVCVNHFVSSEASFQRCKGFPDANGADYKSSLLDSGTDPVEVQSKTAAWLRKPGHTGGFGAWTNVGCRGDSCGATDGPGWQDLVWHFRLL